MNTFLFAWNPENWQWKDLDESIELIEKTGCITEKWSCASHKEINSGDRAFLIRLGVEPKGIMGSGYVISEPFLSKHWEDNKDIYKVLIDFDTLLNPDVDDLLSLDVLNHNDLSDQLWTTQSSGISIRARLTDKLESLWFEFLNRESRKKSINQTIKVPTYKEGTQNKILTSRYERNPYARKKCIEHYGLSCVICDFNFEDTYGKMGENFIHVHHLNPISDKENEYLIDPIKDLRPVCPNCHSMIHRRNPPYSIDEVINIL